MNLILVEPGELDPSGDVTLEDGRATHLLRVLRVAAGSTVRVGLLDGPLGSAAVTALAASRVVLRCHFDSAAPPPPRVDLLLALPRPKVMRRLWAQIAALGVGRIILTNAARVERNYFDTHVLSPACYRPLLVEGLQQARDTRLPLVSIHRQFRPLIEDHVAAQYGEAIRLTADPAGRTRIAPAVAGCGDRRVLLAVGPEGGWTAFERSLLEHHGFDTIGMGPRTLRVDTACVALLSLVHDAIGER